MSPLRHKQGFELLQNWMGGDWGFFVVVIFVSFFFIYVMALLRHNLNTVKFIPLKCISQCF